MRRHLCALLSECLNWKATVVCSQPAAEQWPIDATLNSMHHIHLQHPTYRQLA
jgi:hypothetical protein